MPRLKLIEMDSLNKMIYFRKDDKLIAFDADVAIELISDSLDGKYAPVRHGRWKFEEDKAWAGNGKYLCSVCRYGYASGAYHEVDEFNFCPNCGAKMDEVEDG